MKKLSVFFRVYLWILLLAFSVSTQDFKTVQDGIEYAEMTRTIDKSPVRMNLLRLDLTKVRLDVVHAMDAAIGTETVSSMAKRHDALAAINAGFFRLDRSIFAGDSQGVLQIDGNLLSESQNNRIALGIINGKDRTETNFSHAYTSIALIFFTDIIIDFNGINRERKDRELILYTPEFHRSTLTASNGTEFTVSGCQPCRRNFDPENKGNTLIPNDGFVLSFSRDAYVSPVDNMKKYPRDSWVGISKGVIALEKDKQKFFSESEDIIGGVPQLIKNGKIDITWEQEKSSKAFVETRHPRTAVAKLKDGKFLMITVDGRSEQSAGIGLQHLAEILLELGATDAMNLDGGGSTTMFLEGKIVNQPSDKEGERKVGDAILVFPRKKN